MINQNSWKEKENCLIGKNMNDRVSVEGGERREKKSKKERDYVDYFC